MPTLQEIQRKIKELQNEAERVRQVEINEAVQQIRRLISQYGITAKQIGVVLTKNGSKSASSSSAAVGIPKYRDPKSGKTWTGKGKPPNWIASSRNRDKFLIDKPATQAMPESVVEAAAKKPNAATANPAKKSTKAPAKKAQAATKAAKQVDNKPVEKKAAKKASTPVKTASKAPPKQAAPNKKVAPVKATKPKATVKTATQKQAVPSERANATSSEAVSQP